MSKSIRNYFEYQHLRFVPSFKKYTRFPITKRAPYTDLTRKLHIRDLKPYSTNLIWI